MLVATGGLLGVVAGVYLRVVTDHHAPGAISGMRTPIIGLTSGVLFASMCWRFGWHWELGGYLVLAAALVPLAAIDLQTHRLPRRIIYVAAGLGIPFLVVGAIVAGEPQRLRWALIGGTGSLAFYLVMYLASRGGMGDGDVRLGALLGVFMGWVDVMHVPVGVFAGFAYGALVGLVMLARGAGRKAALPFGPFMALGAVTVVLWGDQVVDAWIG